MNLKKRVNELEHDTGGAELIGVWHPDRPEMVNITMPPERRAMVTLAEWDALTDDKTLVRLVYKDFSEIHAGEV